MGDVGTWLGTGAGIAALFRGLGNRQHLQFQSWTEMVEEEFTDLEPEELRRAVENSPVIAEIVAVAAEEAARTHSEDKRYLLARVAAAALRGDATPGKIDALLYLERTVIALNPADLTLLMVIGTTEDGEPRSEREEQVSRKEMQARWPCHPALLDPALAMLEQQGLIEATIGWDGDKTSCRLRPYSRQFIDHLLIDLGGWPPRRQLESGRS